MPLVDHQLETLLNKGLMQRYDPLLVNPASIDLRLGNLIFVEASKPFAMIRLQLHRIKQLFTKTLPTKDVIDKLWYWRPVDISSRSEYYPYLLYAKAFILAETIEKFYLPSTVSAVIALKSSRGREGFNHCLSGFCDPGWHDSVLTFELVNENRFKPLAVYPGMRIAQAIFDECQAPERDYSVTGRYNNDETVMVSKG